jgi:phosphoglycerate dehydrogenase-like enzyme
MEPNEYDFDLFYHAMNYRGASTQHAEAAWQELLACHERIVEREKQQVSDDWSDSNWSDISL